MSRFSIFSWGYANGTERHARICYAPISLLVIRTTASSSSAPWPAKTPKCRTRGPGLAAHKDIIKSSAKGIPGPRPLFYLGPCTDWRADRTYMFHPRSRFRGIQEYQRFGISSRDVFHLFRSRMAFGAGRRSPISAIGVAVVSRRSGLRIPFALSGRVAIHLGRSISSLTPPQELATVLATNPLSVIAAIIASSACRGTTLSAW